MADNRDLTLTATYPEALPIDRAYSEREAAIRWGAALNDPELNMAAEGGMGAATPEQVAAAPQGATPAAEAPKPSAITTGLEAGARSASEGVRNVIDGLLGLVGQPPSQAVASALKVPVGEQPADAMQAVRKILLEGVVPFVSSPLTAAGAGTRQALENMAPGLAQTEILPDATDLRAIMQGKVRGQLSDEEYRQLSGPLTVGEALDLAVQSSPIWATAALTGGKKAAQKTVQALREQAPNLASERGSFGRPLLSEAEIRQTARRFPSMTEQEIRQAALLSGEELNQRAEQAIAEHTRLLHEGRHLADPELSAANERASLYHHLEQMRAQEQVHPEGPRPLNLGRIDAEQSVKTVMQRLDEFVSSKEPLATHRERVSHEETIAKATQFGDTPAARLLNMQRLMKQEPTTFLPDEATQTALRDAHVAVATVLDDLERRMAAGDAQAQADYVPAFAVALKLGELDVAAGTNLARSLESRKILAEAGRARGASAAALADLAQKIKDVSGIAPEELAAMRATLTQRQQLTWFQSIGAAGAVTRDLLHTLWINSLLTNPVTHTVNLFGTGMGIAWDAALERPVAEMVNRFFRHDPAGVQAGEALQALAHPIQAMEDAVRLVGETWRQKRAPFEKGWGSGKAEVPRITAEQYGFDPGTLPGQFIDVMGTALNSNYMPTSALRLEDAVMKGIAYRMEIGAQAVTQVTAEDRARPMTKAQFAARVKDLEINPTRDMIAAAGDRATQLTMNAELGPFGQAVTKALNTAPGGRWLVPFIRWSGNAFSWTAQRLPVTGEISALYGKNNADLKAGGRLRDQAIARMIVGHAVAGIVAYEVLSGNITGSGAITQKQQGFRPYQECPPYSMKIGGQCGPANYLRTFGQAGQLIAAVADVVELSREIPDNQEWFDRWAALATDVAKAVGYSLVNQTAMQGVANALDEIRDPEHKAGQAARGFARSFVPAGIRQVTRVQDDNIVREIHTMTDAFRSGLPWAVKGIPPLRNPITGEVVQMPAGWGPDILSPVFTAKLKDSPVFAAILDNRVDARPLPWTIGGSANPGDVPRMTEPLPGEGVRLTPEERDDWILYMTQDKLDGQTLHEALRETVESQRYKEMAPGDGYGRQFLMTKTIQKYRKAALGTLLKDPEHADLLQRFEDARRARGNALRPAADPRNPYSVRVPANAGQLLQSLGR